jgi:hypothetical protein
MALCISFEMSGLATVCGEPACDEPCPLDSSGGQCAPNCHFCGCCSLPKLAKPAVVGGAPSLALRSPDWTTKRVAPVTPDPDDIQHVPKLLLA